MQVALPWSKWCTYAIHHRSTLRRKLRGGCLVTVPICYWQSSGDRIDIGLRLRIRVIIDKSILLNYSRYLIDTDRSGYRSDLGPVLPNRLAR
jgi:hypothetical protein